MPRMSKKRDSVLIRSLLSSNNELDQYLNGRLWIRFCLSTAAANPESRQDLIIGSDTGSLILVII